MATIPNTPEQGTSQNSAPSPNNHAEARPGKTPKELKPWQAWFTTLCIPFFISMFLCALLGLFVLTDEKQSTWLGQSWFGLQWRRLVDFNGFFSAAFLNGGILGTITAYVRLREHQTAKQYRTFQSQFKIYKPSDLKQESKQHKRRGSEPKKNK